jgi:hypothetical protein
MKPDTAHSRVCDKAQCLVCASWRAEKREAARRRLLGRYLETHSAQTDLTDF